MRRTRSGGCGCVDVVLLAIGACGLLVALVCAFTIFPKSKAEAGRHGASLPEYVRTRCTINQAYMDEQREECLRNMAVHEDGIPMNHHQTLPGRPHHQRHFPCLRIRVRYERGPITMNGFLHENWREVENFNQCFTSSCSENWAENEKKITEWKDSKDDDEYFTCYYNKYDTEEVVLNSDQSCLIREPGFHAVVWPSVVSFICVLVFIIRRCCLCRKPSQSTEKKVHSTQPNVYVTADKAGPLPEKTDLELGAEVVSAAPVGPPPSYNGHYKDVDTVSMMSLPPPYESS